MSNLVIAVCFLLSIIVLVIFVISAMISRDIVNHSRLSIVTQRLIKLDTYLRSTLYHDTDAVMRIHRALPTMKIVENTSSDHSYTVDKGRYIYLCMRDSNGGAYYDVNTIMYVLLHELAHVGCDEIGHTSYWRDIFAFLVKAGIQCGVYRYVDYRKHPVTYCGTLIDENVCGNDCLFF